MGRYEQAGTPKLEVSTSYDSSAQTYTIHTKQSTPASGGHSNKQPVMLPVAVALFDKQGHELPLKLKVRAGQPSSAVAFARVTLNSNQFLWRDVPGSSLSPPLVHQATIEELLMIESQGITEKHASMRVSSTHFLHTTCCC